MNETGHQKIKPHFIDPRKGASHSDYYVGKCKGRDGEVRPGGFDSRKMEAL